MAKERHHFVPEFYLHGFVDPTAPLRLWIIDKEGGEPYPSTPRDAGLQKHFYSFTTPEGTRDSDTVEDALALIENDAAPVWRKVVAREPMTNAERSIVAVFLSILMTRVPRYRENIEKLTAEVVKRSNKIMASHVAFPEWLANKSRERGKPMSVVEARKAAEFLRSDRYDVTVHPVWTLTTISGEFAKAFHAMNWIFLVARGKHRFVTSDNPLFYADPSFNDQAPLYRGVGLMSEYIEVTCPISRDIALLASWAEYPKPYLSVTDSLVKKINLRTIFAASRFVYSSQRSDGLTRLVQRYKGSGPVIDVQ
jgi:hypothetical protein